MGTIPVTDVKQIKRCENCGMTLPAVGCIMNEYGDGWAHKGPVVTYNLVEVSRISERDLADERQQTAATIQWLTEKSRRHDGHQCN